jgi:membrane fusion protein, heavy metal efflux system
MLPPRWAGLRAGSRAIAVWAMVLMSAVSTLRSTALAHDGHDHGTPAVALPVTVNPRAAGTGDEFEAVAILKDGTLLIFVDRFADNSPVTKAVVTVTIGTKDIVALPAPDGTYRVTWPLDAGRGRHDLVVGIQEGAVNDLLISSLERPATASALTAGSAPTVIERLRGWIVGSPLVAILGALVLMALSTALVLRRKPERRNKAADRPEDQSKIGGRDTGSTRLGLLIGVLLATSTFADQPAAAQAADAATATATAVGRPAPVNTGDAPRRLPDGSVFLPKPTQRLLDVRTELVKEAPHRASQTLVGRVIANPNRSGLVQSSTGGRVTPPKSGLPKLGQPVKAGEILGYVTPAFQAIDSANVAQTSGDLDQQIELARTRLERAQRLLASNAGTRVQAEEAELMLKGLERRRGALNTSQIKAEPLIAPVDGVISSTRAVPGQVVAPQDVLFEIIDGRSLWVEALVFDTAASQAFSQPTASTQDGASFPLTFVGRSRSLRQQSAILQFEITTPPATLDVGTPVTVHAQSGEPITGIVLPRAAVVRSSNGEDVVWRHTEPERFVPTPVRISPFDGARVLVQAGLNAGQRIVVQSAELISQVR